MFSIVFNKDQDVKKKSKQEPMVLTFENLGFSFTSVVQMFMELASPHLHQLSLKISIFKGVKGEIKELEQEMNCITAALHKVSEVPADQLDEQVKIWAGDARELSYDIEDAVDTFMLRGKGHGHANESFSLKGLIGRATNLYRRAKTNHKIHNVIKDIMHQAEKISQRRDRCKVDNIAARPTLEHVDPRLEATYRKASELVGISGPKNELALRILGQDCSLRQQTNIVSIVGFGGLGKTTLANSLLQDLKSKFDCQFFVSVSINPDIKKIFKNILAQLDEESYSNIDEAWEIKLLIDKIVGFLKNKSCLCVIDDVWKESPWDTIKLALQGDNLGSKIIITTRNKAVAEHVGGDIYELKPLSNDDSRELFYKRVFNSVDDYPADLSNVTSKILKKCSGVPLAIITTASLLATKPRCSEEWEKANNSIGYGFENSPHVEKMNIILRLSYNDLPVHLKTCLLSLAKYPDDKVIRKDVLVWSWIAEGFIAPEGRSSLEDIGAGYFNELVNRSLIQPVNEKNLFGTLGEREMYACQIHDTVLELITKLSAEEGFGTTWLSGGEQAGASSLHQREIIRRLSIHNSSNTNASINENKELFKVRSLDVFGSAELMPALSRFRALRVLQLENCSDLDQNNLKDLSNLYLLRFLRLQGLNVTELPESIGKLESLETLDIRGCHKVIMLPLSFGELKKLVRLLSTRVELPDCVVLENMKSLQELVGIRHTLHAMAEICKLRELKVLELAFESTGKYSSKLISTCLQTCPSCLQVLVLVTPGVFYPRDFMAQFPSGLQTFMCTGFFLAFPRWIDTSLACLTILSITLFGVSVQPEHLDKFAGLPSLRFLRLRVEPVQQDTQEKLVIPSRASAFPCLTDLRILCALMFLKFQPGAMQKLRRLCLNFNARLTSENSRTNDFDYSFENLPSLRQVVIHLTAKCPEAQYAIRKTIDDHPNHPSLDLSSR